MCKLTSLLVCSQQLTDLRRFIQAKKEGIRSDNVDVAIKKAQMFLTAVEGQLPVDQGVSGKWLFGLEHPSAADAHVIPFLARLHDVGRGEMVSQALKKYLALAQSTREWKDVMGDRSTMFPHRA